MIIDHYMQRSLYPQTGNFSFHANILPTVLSGVHTVGFSGSQNSNNIEFKLASGRISDWNSQFVATYDVNNLFNAISITGIVGINSVDYYINGEPTAFGVPRRTGNLDFIYTDSHNGSMTLDFFINGDSPSYTLPTLVAFPTGTGSVPINFQNNSAFPFTIFSGGLLGRNDRFSISGDTTGVVPSSLTFYIIPSGMASAGVNILPFSFSTNFGVINPLITMSGQTDPFSGLFVEIIGPTSIGLNSSGQYTVNFRNVDAPVGVVPFLQHLSGSGYTTTQFDITGAYLITGSGNISGFGDISGHLHVTGSGYSGASQHLFSGIIDTTILSYQWATGIQISSLLIPVTGIGTGVNYTGLSSGLMNITTSGTIRDGSGFYHATGLFTGTPLSNFSINPTGTIQATGAIYYNSPVNSDIIWIHNPNIAIIKGYHYNTIDELTSFINTHTGTHFVTGNKVGLIIHLTSLYSGYLGNNSILEENDLNAGDMAVNNPTLIGGQSLGFGVSTMAISNFTGYLNQDINGTGIYSRILSGQTTETRSGIDTYKKFTGVWNLFTGSGNYDYRQHGKYNVVQDTYIFINGKTTAQAGSFPVNITYTGLGGDQDFAILYVSGFNTNHIVSKTISGVRS